MSETKHTPIPWEINHFKLHHPTGFTVGIEGGKSINIICRVECYEGSMADAEFIVRACNSYDALVEALEKIKERENYNYSFNTNIGYDVFVDEIAEQALAKAKEE